jgi:hypothetical protein
MKYLDKKTYKSLSKEKQNAYLVEFLTHLEDLSTREQQSRDNYSLPAWPYFQAEEIGKQKIIRKILTLIT